MRYKGVSVKVRSIQVDGKTRYYPVIAGRRFDIIGTKKGVQRDAEWKVRYGYY